MKSAILALLGSISAVQLNDAWTDINNDIGTYPKQKTRAYASPFITAEEFVDQNHIMPGSMITIPRDERIMRNSALVHLSDLPSNEVANGDSAEDKEVEKENDPKDDVVDYNGHTNRGYGSQVPSEYFKNNKIMAGSHITVPRDDSNPPLGNSLVNL